jgi:hypothetical protein
MLIESVVIQRPMVREAFFDSCRKEAARRCKTASLLTTTAEYIAEPAMAYVE